MLVGGDGGEVVTELEFDEVGQEREEKGEADAVCEVRQIQRQALRLWQGRDCDFALCFFLDLEFRPG